MAERGGCRPRPQRAKRPILAPVSALPATGAGRWARHGPRGPMGSVGSGLAPLGPARHLPGPTIGLRGASDGPFRPPGSSLWLPELGSGVFRRPRTNCGIGACGVAFVSRNSSYRPIDLKPCAKDAGTVPASFWLIDNPTRATPELRDAHATPHAPRKRGHGRRRSYPPALPAQPQAPSDCPLASGAVALAPQHHPAPRRATGCASVRFSPARSSRKRAIPKTPENS